MADVSLSKSILPKTPDPSQFRRFVVEELVFNSPFFKFWVPGGMILFVFPHRAERIHDEAHIRKHIEHDAYNGIRDDELISSGQENDERDVRPNHAHDDVDSKHDPHGTEPQSFAFDFGPNRQDHAHDDHQYGNDRADVEKRRGELGEVAIVIALAIHERIGVHRTDVKHPEEYFVDDERDQVNGAANDDKHLDSLLKTFGLLRNILSRGPSLRNLFSG